jgi:FixJ family two-component response regulator
VIKQSKSCVVAGIDGDARVRGSVKDLLTSAGFNARLLGSAEEFMSTCDRELLGCLITDVRMPGMKGWEFQRLAVQGAQRRSVPWLACGPDHLGAW